jgi:hypothetical protein
LIGGGEEGWAVGREGENVGEEIDEADVDSGEVLEDDDDDGKIKEDIVASEVEALAEFESSSSEKFSMGE